MLNKLIVATLTTMLLTPTIGLVGVGLVMNPATMACSVENFTVKHIPESLEVTTADGATFTLNKRQLSQAATIITVGSKIDGINRNALKIALMAALTESNLRMLSNIGSYPESANYPNDGDGSDHDSLGLFQMRPQAGWGSIDQLMDPIYQAKAFFGGPTGPNFPSPRGLLDIPGWQTMSLGEVAQSVEVSAFPDRYENYAPVAEKILITLTANKADSSATSSTSSLNLSQPQFKASKVVFPLPEGTWLVTDKFGPRIDPISGEQSTHHGLDLGAADGTPILAAADGFVTVAEFSAAWGGLIVVEHQFDSEIIATAYVHMWEHGIHVRAGEQVTAGQHIGDVGSSGYSTGAHLHFEVRPGGTNATAIDPAVWLNMHNAANLTEATMGLSGCKIGGAL